MSSHADKHRVKLQLEGLPNRSVDRLLTCGLAENGAMLDGLKQMVRILRLVTKRTRTCGMSCFANCHGSSVWLLPSITTGAEKIISGIFVKQTAYSMPIIYLLGHLLVEDITHRIQGR